MLLKTEEEGPKVGEHETRIKREGFGKWLPYRAYHTESGAYWNTDDTIGFLWECRPVNFAPTNTTDLMASLMRQDYPSDTTMQFILYPDDNVAPLLDRYVSLKTRQDEVSREAAMRYAAHLAVGVNGLEKMRGIPVRNFRLFVAVKSKKRLPKERIAAIEENLAQAGLGPQKMPAGPLMEWMRRIFNKRVPSNPQAYTEGHIRYLCQQIIPSDDPVEYLDGGIMKVGGQFCAVLSPKTLPGNVDALDMSTLIGGYRGTEDDSAQLTNRFVLCTTIFFRAKKADIKSGANFMMMQRAGGGIAKAIGQRVQEFDWVLDDIERQPYVNIIMSMVLFGKNEDDLNRGIARATSLFEKRDFVMQRESAKGITQAMFIVTLPFGLYMEGANVATLDRDFKVSVGAAARFLPIQSDFAGHMRPVLLFVGRKGQLASVDVFDKGANNYNFLVCANSGAGKSFQTNFLVNNYHGTGALIRAVDIGYSYEKQCAIKKGRFIDVGDAKTQIVLNPFLSVGGDAEDVEMNLLTTAAIVLQMAFSSTGTVGLSESHSTLSKDAVRYAARKDGGVEGLRNVYEYLQTYPKLAGADAYEGASATAHEMAFNLRDFVPGGIFGKLFNGASTFNIGSDDFVVLELENIVSNAPLFSVVSMQVINAITQDLYLSDRSSQRFMLFDEAWMYFGISALISKIIKEGYRRARKYSGSTGIVTQSLLDLQKFGDAGDIIKANSAFKFFLESEDYVAAVDRKIIDYSGLLLELAKTVKNRKPQYSEILFDTPFGYGIGRLCVDQWTYWMNTASGDDFAKFRSLMETGISCSEALNKLAGV